MEDECERQTDEWLKGGTAGEKAPKCVKKLGTVLAQVDAVGSCIWNCPGDGYQAHTIQYMVSRAGDFGRAVLRLARFGFYDEALSLVRSLGEIANLLMLFDLDSVAMIEWKHSDFPARNRRFRPVQIRNRVLQRSGHLPMSEATYQRLCEVSTHPVPDLNPQLFNPHGRLTCGGVFQPAGFIVALNETAELESWIVLLGAKLCQVPEDRRQRIKQDCIECVEATGSLKLLSLPVMWEELGKKGPPGTIALCAKQLRPTNGQGRRPMNI